MPAPGFALGALLALASLLAPVAAHAQAACFTVGGQSAARAQHLVALQDTVRLSADCEYAIESEGPWTGPGALVGRDADFLEIYQQLASQPGVHVEGDPRIVLARPVVRGGARRVDAAQHTLMLRYCVHYLLEEQLAFRVLPEAGGGELRLERVAGDSCGGALLELRALSGARAERVTVGAAEQTLGASQASLALPQGDWSIYAARPGSAAALRVGVFRSQRVVTPLQNHLRTVGLDPSPDAAPPLLAAAWDPGGPGLLLRPTDHALGRDLLWPELTTAADAGLLWLVRTGQGAPVVVGTIQLEAGDPAAVRLPDSVVRDTMRERYGDAGDSLVPTSGDWRAVFAAMAMCLTPSYHDPHTATVGAAVPDSNLCASFGGLAMFAQTEGATGTAGAAAARLCLRHGMQVITADGPEQELGEPDCVALPPPGSAGRAPYRVAIAGDRITVEGEGLCALVDGTPLSALEEGGHEYVLRAGLLEIRQGGGPNCASRQAVARLRMPIVDPQREWHPIGLYTGADEDAMRCSDAGGEQGSGVCPWRALAHDERRVFAYVKPRHELVFGLSTTLTVAASINGDPDQSVQVTQDVPLLSGTSASFGGGRDAAFVAWASRDDRCPSDTPFSELQSQAPLDPDALLVDETFHVFLLGVESADRPAQCLARASFRVRPSRALVAETISDFLGLEVGLLGDTQAVFFGNDPVALGLALPVAWFRMTPGIRFVSLEIALNLVMAASFDPAELSRLGGSLSFAINLGIPEILPRLISIGGMLVAAPNTSAVLTEQPILNFFVGLNLASLIELAGGR